MYASVLAKGGVFTEQRSLVNSFITTTSNNGCNSDITLNTETKQTFLNSIWIGKHDDTQGWRVHSPTTVVRSLLVKFLC